MVNPGNRCPDCDGSVGEEWRRTGIPVAVGYPASKNDLDQRYNKVDRYCHSISLSKSATAKPSTRIPNPLALAYDHKAVFDSNAKKMGPQVALQGMSGGPCLELIRK